MIHVEIPGNIQIELENYTPLFDLLYCNGSDCIANTLKKSVDELVHQATKNKNTSLKSEDFNLLCRLIEAFEKLKETPVMLLVEN